MASGSVPEPSAHSYGRSAPGKTGCNSLAEQAGLGLSGGAGGVQGGWAAGPAPRGGMSVPRRRGGATCPAALMEDTPWHGASWVCRDIYKRYMWEMKKKTCPKVSRTPESTCTGLEKRPVGVCVTPSTIGFGEAAACGQLLGP